MECSTNCRGSDYECILADIFSNIDGGTMPSWEEKVTLVNIKVISNRVGQSEPVNREAVVGTGNLATGISALTTTEGYRKGDHNVIVINDDDIDDPLMYENDQFVLSRNTDFVVGSNTKGEVIHSGDSRCNTFNIKLRSAI